VPEQPRALVPGWIADLGGNVRIERQFSPCNQGFGLIAPAKTGGLDAQKLRPRGESIKPVSAKLSTGRDLAGGQLAKPLNVQADDHSAGTSSASHRSRYLIE
jgi:hypothetical protein